jgi:uncharacterized protein YkwD
MQKQKARPTSIQHKKRQGAHHRQSKPYLKVYWPYVPMLLIVIGGFVFNAWLSRPQVNGVLAYATEISSQKLLETTNKQRSTNGKSSLAINDKLTAAAQAKANDMAKRNYWSHTTPEGNAPWVFVKDAGYAYQKAGENLAYGFNSSSDTVAGWMNSKTHRENLLDVSYSEVGFGYANVANFNKSGPETVVVAMYGEPQTAGIANQAPTSAPTNDNPVTSDSSRYGEPATLAVSRIQSLTGGSAPWISFAVGLFIGGALIYMTFKHGRAFKRAFIHGEEFFLHHPVLDVALVGLVMVGYILTQTAGVIR